MPKPTKPGYISLTLVVLLTLLVSACAPTAGTPGAGPSGGASSDLDPNQELRANIDSDPPGLDPNASQWDTSIAVISLVYRGLLRFKDDLTLEPAVAREVPSISNGGISADGKTYTLKLRNDVKWSDGKLVTAKDFEYSIKRMLDPKLAAPYASFYYTIVGAQEYNSAMGTKSAPKTPDAAALASLRDGVGIKSTDDTTLVITLKDARSSFLSLLALHSVVPVRQDIIEAKGERWFADPASYIGNGPYRMTEYLSKDHITLVPNENYFGTKPKLKKITLTMVEDPNANYAAYLSGERDVARVPPANVPVVLADPALKEQVHRAPRLATIGIFFNTKMPPFDNPKVRKALSMAFDRLTFIDKVRRGVGKPATSWIPPGMPGHQPDLGKEWGFDPAKAKQMLAEAGYPDGKGLPPISFQYANVGANQITAEYVQAQFKDNLGIDVKLEPMEGAELSRLVGGNRYQMAIAGWTADYPDPDNWLPEIFGCNAGNNHTQYCNPQLDEQMKVALTEKDDAKRLDLWAKIQKAVVDDVPMLFILYDERFILVKPYVKGLKVTGIDTQALAGNFFLEEVFVLKH